MKSKGYVKGYEYVLKVIHYLNGSRLTYTQLHRKIGGSHSTLNKVVAYLVRREVIEQFENPKFPFQHWLIAKGG
jgi:DNA-binding HxlR family transcriptional regulator